MAPAGPGPELNAGERTFTATATRTAAVEIAVGQVKAQLPSSKQNV